jgi:hypothetical protein
MAAKKTKKEIDQLRQDLFGVNERQGKLLAERTVLMTQLDLVSDGESAILREQRRWNTIPPPLRPLGPGGPALPSP